MYVVTNRNLTKEKGGLEILSEFPNAEGPNNLRLVKVGKEGGKYVAEVLDEGLTELRKTQLINKYGLTQADLKDKFRSLDVADELFTRALKQKLHILIFVHGYNNDIGDVLKTAEKLESLYKVVVVPFSWPANGGGPLSGTAAYLSDKRDARVSTGAFDRFLEKIDEYHSIFTFLQKRDLWDKAKAKHPTNPQEARAEYSRMQDRVCKVSINLLCHSMGNYLLKYATKPSASMMRKLIFDNVCLVAADANNQDHRSWVEAIQTRSGTYIVINEKDSALKWSRRKPGEAQLARLGHYLKGLNAGNVSYLNVTTAAHVGDKHSYFKGTPVGKKSKLLTMFSDLFEGRKPDDGMKYRSDINAYELRR